MPLKGKGYVNNFNKNAPAGNTPNQKSQHVPRVGGNSVPGPATTHKTGNIPVR